MPSNESENVDSEILNELSPRNLVYAYAQGIFPMVEDGELMWFRPDPRGIMPVDERFHVSRSLKKLIRQGKFVCTVDHCFDLVVDMCGDRPDGSQTWISPEIKLSYHALYEMNLAHSVEAWPADAVGKGRPAGGLYGVSLGGGFFAESMFHRQRDAGKVAVAFLIERLAQRGFLFCDIQWTTENLKRFGAFDMPDEQYQKLLEKALELECSFD